MIKFKYLLLLLTIALIYGIVPIFSIDQRIDQITGSEGGGPKERDEVEKENKRRVELQKQSQSSDPEIQQMRDEIELLKQEMRALRAGKPLSEEEKKKRESEKPTGSPVNTLFFGDEDMTPQDVEDSQRYGGFSRELFMQVQSPDFKKGIAERYQWQLLYWTHGNYFNNGNLRRLDETNQTSIERTDDRVQFIAGGIQFDSFFPVHPRLDLRFDVWRFGFWGQDQLAGRDTNNDIRVTQNGANTLNFGQLYFDWHFKLNPRQNDRVSLRVGRQDFRLGGRIFRDFHQDDILDAIVFKWHDPKWGKLDLLLVDVFSNAPDTRDVNFIRFLSFSSPTVNNFDGRADTLRHGFKYRYSVYGDSDFVGSHLEIAPFYFIAHYSGSNQPFGGADRSFLGTAGNFIDNDYVVMRGARLNYGIGRWFRSAFTYAESFGVDRKVPSLLFESRDVDTNGKSYHLEMEFSAFRRRLRFQPSYFFSDGGRYYANGQQYSTGFVSFKGDQVGGILTDLYWGVHPTAYTSHQGTVDELYRQDRKTGTQFKHLGFYFGILSNLFLKLDWWRMEDTNQFSFLGNRQRANPNFLLRNNSGINTEIQNFVFEQVAGFYPDNNAVILAARRMGAPLGEEYNVGLDWNVFRGFKVWATWGVLIPMRFYATQGLIQDAPQGNARFTGFQLGTSLIF
ncbi:MAG: hypothetical protein JJT78_03690 [Leptospira sp.]|nr:hypothetical protein [Leptospira sp.]